MSEKNQGSRPEPVELAPKDGGEPTWQVRTKDGEVHGPLGIAGLQALFDEKILTREAEIASPDTKDWHAIAEHPIWPRLNATPWMFTREKPRFPAGEKQPGATTPSADRDAFSPSERRSEAQRREIQRLARALRYWRLARVLRVLRAVLVFLLFVTAGDLIASYLGGSTGTAQWTALMCLMAVAVGYYTLKALDF